MKGLDQTLKLKPYPDYKCSGIERFPEVPRHWNVVALKRLGTFKSGAGFPVGEQGLTTSERTECMFLITS